MAKPDAPFFILTSYNGFVPSYTENETYKRWSGPWSDAPSLIDALSAASAGDPDIKFFVCGSIKEVQSPLGTRIKVMPIPTYDAVPASEFLAA